MISRYFPKMEETTDLSLDQEDEMIIERMRYKIEHMRYMRMQPTFLMDQSIAREKLQSRTRRWPHNR